MGTNAVYTARIDKEKLMDAQEAAMERVKSGSYEPDTFYVLDENLLALVASNLRDDDVLAKVDGFYVVAPGWRSCKDCPELDSEIVLKGVGNLTH